MFNKYRNAAIILLVIVLLFWSSPLETTEAQLTPSLPKKTVSVRPHIQQMTPSVLNVYQKSTATATVTGPGVQQLLELVKVLKNGQPVPGVTAQLVWGSVDTRQLKISADANAVPTQDCTLQFYGAGLINLDLNIGRGGLHQDFQRLVQDAPGIP